MSNLRAVANFSHAHTHLKLNNTHLKTQQQFLQHIEIILLQQIISTSNTRMTRLTKKIELKKEYDNLFQDHVKLIAKLRKNEIKMQKIRKALKALDHYQVNDLVCFCKPGSDLSNVTEENDRGHIVRITSAYAHIRPCLGDPKIIKRRFNNIVLAEF